MDGRIESLQPIDKEYDRFRLKHLIFDIELFKGVNLPEKSIDVDRDLILRKEEDGTVFVLKDGINTIQLLNELTNRGYAIAVYSDEDDQELPKGRKYLEYDKKFYKQEKNPIRVNFNVLKQIEEACASKGLNCPPFSTMASYDKLKKLASSQSPSTVDMPYKDLREGQESDKENNEGTKTSQIKLIRFGENKVSDNKSELRQALSKKLGIDTEKKGKGCHIIFDSNPRVTAAAKNEGYDTCLVKHGSNINQKLLTAKYDVERPPISNIEKIFGESEVKLNAYKNILKKRNKLAKERKDSWFYKETKREKIDFWDRVLDK